MSLYTRVGIRHALDVDGHDGTILGRQNADLVSVCVESNIPVNVSVIIDYWNGQVLTPCSLLRGSDAVNKLGAEVKQEPRTAVIDKATDKNETSKYA